MAAPHRPRRRVPPRRPKRVVKKAIVSATNVVVAVAVVAAAASGSTARRSKAKCVMRCRRPPTLSRMPPTTRWTRRSGLRPRRRLRRLRLACRRKPMRPASRVPMWRLMPLVKASGKRVVVATVVAVAATGSAIVTVVSRASRLMSRRQWKTPCLRPQMPWHPSRYRPSYRPRLPSSRRCSSLRSPPRLRWRRRPSVRRWRVTSAAAVSVSHAARPSTSCDVPSKRWCRATIRRAPARRARRRSTCSAATASR